MKHSNHFSAMTFTALAAAALMAACSTPDTPSTIASPGAATTPSAAAPARSPAIARLITPSGQPGGQAELRDTANGLEITINVQGLTPGQHGFHVHANGACAEGPDAASGTVVPFGAAGGHFDPGQSRNHGRPGQGAHEAHGGELPNITVGADGRGTLRYVNANLNLAPGKTSALGRTLIVHQDADDYQTDPAGNSGGRALCGLIEPAQPGPVTGRA